MPNNDLISRAELARDLSYSAPELFFDKDYLMTKIARQPAVDAVEVVRCRDCKYGEPTHNAHGEAVIKCEEICWLCRLPRLMEPDWFCADGERRDDDAAD